MSDPWIHRSTNMKCRTCMWFCPKALPPGTETVKWRYDSKIFRSGGKVEDTPRETNENIHRESDTPPPIVGRCRRHAPSMNGYPVVFPDDWCGDHKLNEAAL